MSLRIPVYTYIFIVFSFASTSLFKLLSLCLTPPSVLPALFFFMQALCMQLRLFLNLPCRLASSLKSSRLHLEAGVKECAAMPGGELAFLGTLTRVLLGVSWLLGEFVYFS